MTSGAKPVSVIIPCSSTGGLAQCLDAIADQDYAGDVEAVIGLAPNAGRVPSVEGLTVRQVDNPSGRTPDALNAAVGVAVGSILVRADVQSRLSPSHVRRAVELLDETSAWNVGGGQQPVPRSTVQAWIAAAMQHPLGAGGAAFRRQRLPGPVDTVYLGAFPASALESLGGFDPRFDRNQDYELNLRIVESGHEVFFHPDLDVSYEPRKSLIALASQYFQYGRWRRATSRVHPGSLKPRQLAAPVLVVAGAMGLLGLPLGYWQPIAALGIFYVGGLATAAVQSRQRTGWWGLPVAAAVMHVSWGIGFLGGIRLQEPNPPGRP